MKSVALALGCLSAAVAVTASGQQGPDEGLQEVVVTAQFRQQSLQDTPLAITAVNAEMLEARNQVSITDITAQAPNVMLKPAPGPFGPSIQAFIRGVGQSDFNFALEPGVGMYVDDVYYSTLTGSVFDLLDLDRVEILRGPQGTLAGQNSIGGAVKLYSKKPTGEDSGYIQATYGRFNRTDVRAGADVTLVKDQLFARIAGVTRHQDGYVTRYDFGCTHPGSGVPSTVISDNCKLGTEGGKSYDAIRGSLRWVANDNLEVNVIGDYTNDNSEASPITLIYVGHTNIVRAGVIVDPAGPGISAQRGTAPLVSYNGLSTSGAASGVPLGTATGSAFIAHTPFNFYQAQDTFSHSPYVNYSTYTTPNPLSGTAPGSADGTPANNGFTIPPVSNVSGYGYSGTVDYKFSDSLALKSITAYRRYSGRWSIDEDATPISVATLYNDVWHHQFSEELRLNAKLFGSVNATLGGLYFEQKSHYGGRVDLETSRLDFLESDDIPGNTKAVFGNADWAITQAFSLIAGVRYTEQSKTFVYGRDPVPGNTQWAGLAPPAVRGLDGLSAKYEGNKTDYRVAAQYRWMPELMTYVQVATGFKGGGVNPRPFFPQQAVPHQPETLTAYEAGAKADLFNNRVRINGAVFLNKYENILFTVNNCPFPGVPPAPCALPLNAGKANVKGAELETDLRLFGGFSLDASASYLDFDYTEISAAALASGILKSMTSPFSPKTKYAAGAQYLFKLGGLGSITPRVDWSYQSAYHSGAINSRYNRVPNYHTTNARITWRSADDKWDASLEGTNLTNEVYYLGFFDNQGSTQSTLAAPAPPRQWAVSFRRSF